MALVVREALMEYLQDEYTSPDAPPPYSRFPDPTTERIVSHFPDPELAARHQREASQGPLLSGLVASRIFKKTKYSFRRGTMRQVNFLDIRANHSLEFTAKFSLVSTTLNSTHHQQLGLLLRTSAHDDPVFRWMLHCVLPHPISPEHSASTLICVNKSRFRLTLLFRPEPIEFDWVLADDAYELKRRHHDSPLARLSLSSPRPALRFQRLPDDSEALHFLLSAAHILNFTQDLFS